MAKNSPPTRNRRTASFPTGWCRFRQGTSMKAETDREAPASRLVDTRRDQMFPTLERWEIDRLRRFGEVRSYGAGEALSRVGETGHGLRVVLDGEVAII